MKELCSQLIKWRDGESVHNDITNECCPDFSCCRPHLLADRPTREAFCRAEQSGDEATKTQMLMMFLGATFSDYNIHIAGDAETKEA